MSPHDIIFAFLILTIFQSSSSANNSNFCSEEPQMKDDESFGFTRWGEISMIVLRNKSMSIPCCVKGYTEIKWFYNDVPLEKSNSSFSMNSKDARYIHSEAVKQSDGRGSKSKGNYTCQALSTHHKSISHTITVHVSNTNYTGPPIVGTYPTSVIAVPGETVDFWCSAFLGFFPKDYYNKIIDWHITPQNKNRRNFESKNYKFTASGGGVMIGSLLKMPKVEKSMFGLRASCYAVDVNDTSSTHEDQIELQHAYLLEYEDETRFYKISIIILMFTVTLAVTLALLVARYHVEIRLLYKDKFAKLENQDLCEWDVFLCYCEDSHKLVYEHLVPHLENLGYSCFAYERDALGGEHLSVSLTSRISRCRRFLVVLSAGLMTDPLGLHICRFALDQALGPRALRIVIVQPPAQQKKAMMMNGPSEYLRNIMNVSRKATLPRNATARQKQRFLSELCLHLPPLRNQLPWKVSRDWKASNPQTPSKEASC